MVDTSRNRVIFADCGGDFVDIVLSSLTLPMASIFRLIGKDDMPVGSMHNIYRSVESLDNSYFRNEACKTMLLRPFDVAMAKLYSFLAISSENLNETREIFYCHYCFSSNKICSLYKGAQCSCGWNMDTLLTDTFLNDGKVSSTLQPEADFFPGTETKSSSLPEAIKLKLAINKRDKTVIFAEDNSEFVNLLFSFLRLPVGCIVKLFDGQINFGCFQNIYKSVEALRLADCFISKERENMVMCPKSPPFSSTKNVPLIQVQESEPDTLYVCSKFPSCITKYGKLPIGYKTCVCLKSGDVPVSLQDPKQSESAAGFIIGSTYVISYNLSMNPWSGISVASFYLDGAFDGGLEFITVEIGPQQVHNLHNFLLIIIMNCLGRIADHV
ncbi:hypothetical protein KSP39_PZI012907 [Platanthera zijinensis]|uniref:DUF674 family protein n=1 Tax=Platanthera zijinensis TaxID=2320716 RepID=A0AAP0BC60_9ASPA